MNNNSIESTNVNSICDYSKRSISKRFAVVEEPNEFEEIRCGMLMELTGSDRIERNKFITTDIKKG